MNDNEVMDKIKEVVELVKERYPEITYLSVAWLNENGEDYFNGYAEDKDGQQWKLSIYEEQ